MATARAVNPPPVAGCTPLFDAAAMREADRRTTHEHALPSLILMERAGLATAQAILERYPDRRRALILAGSGNNGGDGWVVARHLREAGWSVRVATPDGEPPATPDAAVMARAAISLGIAPVRWSARSVDRSVVVVDALLGTGARGAPRGRVGEMVAWLARCRAPVVSCDLPSGVDADTGVAVGPAAVADLTVTYHGDLVGLRITPGANLAGDVVVADIGVPGAVRTEAAAWRADRAVVAGAPRKGASADKYASGAVLVVAGSPGMTGAACLAARATLRAGAGLAVVATPAAVQPAVAAHLLEVMCAPVPDRDGALAENSVDAIVRQSGRVAAVAVGPGVGRAEATTFAVEGLVDRIDLPLVVDADGLWHLGDRPERLAGRRAPTIITPHSGEAARLLGVARDQVDANRLESARRLAQRARAVVVLKGAGSIIAAPDGTAVVSATGSAVLATAGSGDVLTGVAVALCSKGLDPLRAAVAAVVAHGLAGELAGRGDGTVASDVVETLPEAMARARSERALEDD